MTVGKQFEKNFAMICFLLSPSGGKRKTHFSLQNSERPFCLPTVTHSPPVSAIMALNIMYRQKKTDGNRPRLPSVSVAFLCILHNPLFMIRVVGLCNMLKLTIFQRKSQNIIDIYTELTLCVQAPSHSFCCSMAGLLQAAYPEFYVPPVPCSSVPDSPRNSL